MDRLVVKRLWMQADKATISDVYYQGQRICSMVEKPWKNNDARISCIPLGVYPLSYLPSGSITFKYPCFLLKDVPDRTAIMIHRANRESELLGCLAPNMVVNAQQVGSRSTEALDLIVNLHQTKGFSEIEIMMA